MSRTYVFIFAAAVAAAILPIAAIKAFPPALQAPAVMAPYVADDGFVRETPARVSAGYVIIHNPTDHDDRLIGVEFPAQDPWAERAELHNVTKDADGVLKMFPVDGADLPAHGVLALRPGGMHVMFYDVAKPLQIGHVKTVVLRFEKGGTLPVDMKVHDINYTGKDGAAAIPVNTTDTPETTHHY